MNQRRCCGNCKWHGSDYVWDDEYDDEYDDEIEVFYCLKHYRDEIEYDTEPCEHYKRFRPKPYIEKDTKCDLCDMVAYCASRSGAINITTMDDKRQHVMMGLGYQCPKEEAPK